MMTPEAWALAQFEPDPDGLGSVGDGAPPVAAPHGDEPQWIVWPDAADESAWAAAELDLEWRAAARLAGR
jgi:hypothetical protein